MVHTHHTHHGYTLPPCAQPSRRDTPGRPPLALSSPYGRLRAMVSSSTSGPRAPLSSGWPAPHSPAPPIWSPSLLARVPSRVAWWLRATRIASELALRAAQRNGPPAGRGTRGPRARHGRPVGLWPTDLSAIGSQLALQAAGSNQFSCLPRAHLSPGQYPSSPWREGILSWPGERLLARPERLEEAGSREPASSGCLGGKEASREASREPGNRLFRSRERKRALPRLPGAGRPVRGPASREEHPAPAHGRDLCEEGRIRRSEEGGHPALPPSSDHLPASEPGRPAAHGGGPFNLPKV